MGIVVEVVGAVEPPLSAMTEIPANEPLRLAAGARLTFLHYTRCRLVTVSGGTLSLSPAEFHTDGRIESDTDGPCPRVYVPQDTALAGRTTGALLLRGSEAPPRWPVNPEFVMTGKRADEVTGVVILGEEAPDDRVLRLDVQTRRATLPSGALPLLPGQRYRLRLMQADRPEPMEMTFIGIAPDASGSLVILRLD